MLRIHAVLLCTAASFLASAQMTVQPAVRDPESLARFLESQRQPIDWPPIIQALSIPNHQWFPCAQIGRDVRCETELLTLVDPHQTIIRAHDGSTAVYLRYRKLAEGWGVLRSIHRIPSQSSPDTQRGTVLRKAISADILARVQRE